MMQARFRWNDWNVEHIARHSVVPAEAERIVRSPLERRRHDRQKYIAYGQTSSGRWLQVIYIFDPPGIVYVIHARALTDVEKRQARRRQR